MKRSKIATCLGSYQVLFISNFFLQILDFKFFVLTFFNQLNCQFHIPVLFIHLFSRFSNFLYFSIKLIYFEAFVAILFFFYLEELHLKINIEKTIQLIFLNFFSNNHLIIHIFYSNFKMEQASNQFQNGNISSAIAIYSDIIEKKQEKWTDALLNRGSAYYIQGQY